MKSCLKLLNFLTLILKNQLKLWSTKNFKGWMRVTVFLLFQISGSSLQRKKNSTTSVSGEAAPKHKPLSGLIDEISSMSSSNVTSPNSQSSYNPLLDDTDLAASSDYAIMSPASSGKLNPTYILLYILGFFKYFY